MATEPLDVASSDRGGKGSSRRWIGTKTLRRGVIALAALACGAICLAVWCLVRYAALSVEVGLARERVQVIAYATDRALRGTPAEAAAHLEYVLGYYPPGQGRSAGAELDAIVETHRRVCTRQIIEHLKRTTGENLGDEPRAWIERFKAR